MKTYDSLSDMKKWTMFAHDLGEDHAPRRYRDFGSKRFVQAHGGDEPIVEVVLAENPEGIYWGMASNWRG